MAGRARWLPLKPGGAWNAELRRLFSEASGVYVFRRKGASRVAYVGESHTGRGWKTLQRHFQDPTGGFEDRSEFTARDASGWECAVFVTSTGAREKKHGDQAALDLQAQLIERYRPTENRDDGKAYPTCPHGCTSWRCARAHNRPELAAPSSTPDDDFAFGANAPAEEGGAFDGLINPSRPRMQVLLGSTRSRELLRRMKALGWGRLFAGEVPTPSAGEPWALDNGVFSSWKSGEPWTDTAFVTGLNRYERAHSVAKMAPPLFAVLPDRVADPSSLAFSLDWLERVGFQWDVPWYLVLQNGMTADRVRAALRANPQIAGLFLGGDDAFKLEARAWCELAHGEGRRFHFARVSTVARLKEAHAIGADSCDTSQPLWSQQAWERFERAALELGDASPAKGKPPVAGYGVEEKGGQLRLTNPPPLAPNVAPEKRAENRTPDLFTGRTKLEEGGKGARRDWKGEAERAARELAECRRASSRSDEPEEVDEPPPPPPKPRELPEGYGETNAKGQASMFRNPRSVAPVVLGELVSIVYEARRGGPRIVKKFSPGRVLVAYRPSAQPSCLVLVFRPKVTGASSAAGRKEYAKTHWGKPGDGERLTGDVLEGDAPKLGTVLEITYATAKGGDSELVDYWHTFGDYGGLSLRKRAFIPPALEGATVGGRQLLRLVGGSYTVTAHGIVG